MKVKTFSKSHSSRLVRLVALHNLFRQLSVEMVIRYGASSKISDKLSVSSMVSGIWWYSINQQWHNSPLWAKAFLRSFCHPSLFLAALLHYLSPNFLASPITPSSHLSLGLPFCLLPSTTAVKTLLAGFWSSSRMTCPAHLRQLILMYVIMSLSLHNVYN